MKRYPEWKGRLQKRFRWKTLRMEWGRYCYIDDYVWWEWEEKK